MSRKKARKAVKIEGGKPCPKCRRKMQRFKHPDGWIPSLGRNYFSEWDRCFICKYLQHYEEFKKENLNRGIAHVGLLWDKDTWEELEKQNGI